ncbi:MAG: LacI family DNA-binding transcriptional regulator [Dysgonamonadaceae bacterium]
MKNKRSNRVSLKDVANRAGVSKTLVSAVLNGKAKQYRISDKTALLVLQTAKEMQYSPNMIARGLRTGKAELIGLIVTDISNPFYSTISRIIENKTSELNYKVIFGSSDENLSKTEELIDIMLNKGVDGLIIVPCEGSQKLIEKLHNNNVPVVLLDRYFPELNVSYSCLNNYNATKLATLHLIKQGYKNISLIAYNSELSNIKDRISGYQETMMKNSLETSIHVKSVDINNPTPEIEKALDYLITKKNTEAIIFITNALLVAGLRSLNKMNKVIPQDVAVVGFYGSELFDLFYSPITYIKQPIEVITEKAVKMLIDKINKGENFKFSKSFIEPELIIQDSSIRPK